MPRVGSIGSPLFLKKMNRRRYEIPLESGGFIQIDYYPKAPIVSIWLDDRSHRVQQYLTRDETYMVMAELKEAIRVLWDEE